jgi:glycosyltransferase involved in cell wall biosynthesis
MPPRRVLMVQPSIEPPGGGNAVACWMIEALKCDHDITLLTRSPPDLQRANLVFGTTLSAGDLRVEIAPAALSGLARVARPVAALTLLRDHAMLAHARGIAGRFDLVMTANNESDLGAPGIQYVHFPKFIAARPDATLRWYQRPGAVRAYHAVCAAATGFSATRMRANLTLVNSRWTGQLTASLHGVEPFVLHPPAAGPFPEVAWDQRAAAFACVGRLAPEKDLESVMAILARVREAHPGISLRIAGSADDRAYAARIEAAARAHGDWVRVDVDLPRDRLVTLMTSCRYGIHGMHDEHFGMAVAELVCAGATVFAHDSGGQVEILRDPRLRYRNADDAVQKILRVLDDEPLEHALRADLKAGAARFSSQRFIQDFRAVVAAH